MATDLTVSSVQGTHAFKSMKSLVEENIWLGRLCTLFKYSRELWLWRRHSMSLGAYCELPALAIGDLGLSQLGHDSSLLSSISIVTEVACCSLMAESYRSSMMISWREMKWELQCFNLNAPNSSKLEISKWQAIRNKIIRILTLCFRILWNAYNFTMFLIDITSLLGDNVARERARGRIFSNMYHIQNKLGKQLEELSYKLSVYPSPVFKQIGFQPKQVQSIAAKLSLIAQLALPDFLPFVRLKKSN